MNTLGLINLFYSITVWSIIKFAAFIIGFYLGYCCSHSKAKKTCAKIDALIILVLFIILVIKYLILNYFITPSGVFENLLIITIFLLVSILFGTAYADWIRERQKKRDRKKH